MRIPILYFWRSSWQLFFISTHISINAFWKEKLSRQPILSQSLSRVRSWQLDLSHRKHKSQSFLNMPSSSQNPSHMMWLFSWNWIINEFSSSQTKSDIKWNLENSMIYVSDVMMMIIFLWIISWLWNLTILIIANLILIFPYPLLSRNESLILSWIRSMILLFSSQ